MVPQNHVTSFDRCTHDEEILVDVDGSTGVRSFEDPVRRPLDGLAHDIEAPGYEGVTDTSYLKRKERATVNEIVQLIGFFCVIQGVLLSSEFRSNLLHCNKRSIVFVFSAIVSAGVLTGPILRFRTAWKQRRHIETEMNSSQQSLLQGRNFSNRRSGFRSHLRAKNALETEKIWLAVYFVIFIFLSFLFLLVIVVAVYSILCPYLASNIF